jgi:hypothetical protein
MKRIFLLSTLLLSQTLFGTTLMIYDSNIALVSESKDVHFPKGEATLLYGEIPKSIIANSLQVKLPDDVALIQQKYQKANLTLTNVAKSFLHKEVFFNAKPYKLVALSGSRAFIEAKNREIHTCNITELSFKKLPKNLHNSYALLFITDAKEEQQGKITLNYLLNNITFESDYSVNLHKKSADLKASVTITNRSSKDYKAVDVTLLAGELSRVKERHPHPVMYKSATIRSDAPMQIQFPNHKSVAIYHSYTLANKIDLTGDAINRITLLQLHQLPYEKIYSVTASNPLYLMGERSMQVNQAISLKKITQALPKGTLRLYGENEQAKRVLLGETKIANHPKNTPLLIPVGKDFDTRLTQTIHSRKDTKSTLEATVVYTITNNSDSKKSITLSIPFTKKEGSRIITDKKYRFTKGNLATFSIEVAPNSSESFEARFISKRR